MEKIIKGMNVLEQTPIKEYTTLSDVFMIVGLIIIILSFVMFVIRTHPEKYIRTDDKRLKKMFLGYAIGFAIVLFSMIRFPFFYVETGRNTYKCELEDSVSAKYISDNFNIINVESNVWTIEDK